jgi:hypothetical protein
MNDYFPPTPAPSLPSPTMNGDSDSKSDATATADHKSYPHFTKSHSASPMGPLPPTPPEEKINELERLKIEDEGIPQRIRRGRTPILTENGPGSERSSSEAGQEGQSAQRLTVDLEGYSGEYDESREPTLSFHTSSTVESTTGTPSSTHHNYGFGSSSSRDKAGQEIRVRSTSGRATAYSSAESSGAYSYHQYVNHVFQHPHPPPLPDRPAAYAEPVGLGYPTPTSQDEAEEEDEVPVPDTNFSYRPWESEEVNRNRSHSGVSLSSIASRSSRGQSSSLQHYDYHYPDSLPWDTQRALENESQAVAMVEEGREKTFDMGKLREMGGIEAITDKEIATMSGTSSFTSTRQWLTIRYHPPPSCWMRR